MKKLFLAWQDISGRQWYTVGRLTLEANTYHFVYTKGVLKAQKEAGFQPFPSFPDLHQVYSSEELFPLFSNRLLSPSRADYSDFVEWLSLREKEAHPMNLLARSGGKRVTDLLEVFPIPEKDASGQYEVHFFVHGLSHAAPASTERALRLEPGEQLLLMHDFQNPWDPDALSLRTSEKIRGDMYLMGYCPRYLLGDVHRLTDADHYQPKVTVERVNHPPAPIQFRLLCRITMKWPDEFHPFSDTAYEPLVPELTSVM